MLYKNLLSWSWLSPYLQLDPAVDASQVEVASNVKQVAIIGAGAAGASAAYHLHQYAEQEGVAVNLTVFEKTPRIGGRTLTVDVYGDAAQPVELGASIFVDVNHVLVNATRALGLPLRGAGADEDGVLAVWDGRRLVYAQDSAAAGWWNLARLFLKYGTAPYWTHRLVQRTVAAFLQLYDAPYFPFRSLSERAHELDLVKITGLTGEQFLAQNKLNGAFAHDIVQASTRVNYAANLASIHGLGTMVAMAPEGAQAVVGGNWRIFDGMVKMSEAAVLLNTSVTGIVATEKPKSPPSSSSSSSSPSLSGPQEMESKYRIQTSATADYPLAFDDVVVATPWQFGNFSLRDGNGAPPLPPPVEEIPYATLHVTLFATPFRFSPAFFGLAPGATVPVSVLTTLPPAASKAEEEGQTTTTGDDGDDDGVGFYSATLVQTAINPATRRREFVYKVFSPEPVTPQFLSALLGVEVPLNFTRAAAEAPATSPAQPESVAVGEDSEVEAEAGAPAEERGEVEMEVEVEAVDPISWHHATVFRPYPQKLPRVTFQDPVLRDDGLYYTSGVESFISTMETSALMGMNVARLIADGYAAAAAAEAAAAAAADSSGAAEQQQLEMGDAGAVGVGTTTATGGDGAGDDETSEL